MKLLFYSLDMYNIVSYNLYDSVDFQVSEDFCIGSHYDDIGYIIMT